MCLSAVLRHETSFSQEAHLNECEHTAIVKDGLPFDKGMRNNSTKATLAVARPWLFLLWVFFLILSF